jgi:hypothetical protein
MMFLALTLFVLSAASVNAQVNIGSMNDPHKGAILDLSQSKSKLGVLFPSVHLFNTREFTLPVDGGVAAIGMVIYNSNVDLPDGAGLYAWNGSDWTSMSAGNANSCVPVTATAASKTESGNAKITVTVTAGNPTFSYIWSKDGSTVRTTTNVTATSDSYTTTGADTYTVTVTNPCTATPVSFTFEVDNSGEALTDNGNNTYTDSQGNLIYEGETFAPVESDVLGIYLDEGGEIVYTGADGIPGNDDDEVFVVPDYPLPAQETLFSIKYPLIVHQDGSYSIELDFADSETTYVAGAANNTYKGKIKFVSSNSDVIAIENESGVIKAGSTVSTAATIVIILDDGSIITKSFTVLSETVSNGNKLDGVRDGEVTLTEGAVRQLSATAVAADGSGNANNRARFTYSIDSSENPGNTTSSEVTPGGWFHAGTPGIVTVTATATDDDGKSFTGAILVTILDEELPAEALPYETDSKDWATLPPAPKYAGGDGTEANPYQISSVRQLKKLAVDIALLGSTEATYQQYFELTTDLDFSADNSVKLSLIGTFYGTLDGKGHVIKDLNIDATGKSNISLINGLSYGEIKNFGREGGSTTGDDVSYISGLVGALANGGKLINCYNSSSISVQRVAAGLVYNMNNAVIQNCYNTGDIIASGELSGGLAAIVLHGGGNVKIINSYNTGNVAGAHRAGGIIGYINGGQGNKQILEMNNSFNFGDVSISMNNDRVGSILGRPSISTVLVEVYATNVYSRQGVASANKGAVAKPNQPIGWLNAEEQALKTAILDANPTLREDAKYSPEYSKSQDFATELGGAFKYAPGLTPKLAWEK